MEEMRIDPTIAYDVVELPSRGIHYSNKRKSVRVAYLTAADENILSSPSFLNTNTVIPELLKRKILDRDFPIDEIVEEDRQAILIFLRNTAFGSEYILTSYYPKSEKEFWNGMAIMEKNKNEYFFPYYNETIKLPYGQYKMSIYSEFGERIDTVLILNSSSHKTIFHIDWKYKFDSFDKKLFESMADTIIIKYEYKYCCGGISCSNKDKLEFYKTSTGQYRLKYYNNIYTGNTDNTTNDTLNEKLLDIKKNQEIKNYLTKNNIPYDTTRVIECTVIMGRHVYAVKSGSYISFKQDLIK